MAMDSKSHRCSICSKTFARPSKLQYHIAYHHEKRFPFECTQCGKAYSNQDHVNRHYRTAHEQHHSKAIRHCCTAMNCHKSFANKQNLDRHIRSVHQARENKSVKCFHCAEWVPSLELHLTKAHRSHAPDQLRCLDCAKEFSSIKRLMHHRIIHTDERRESDVRHTVDRMLEEIERTEQKFECDLCQQVFRSLFQLDQHRHSKIHQEQYSCQHPNCSKVFRYMRNLRQHVRVHHEGLARLACPMASCSKTFTCQASIYRHVIQCHSTADIVAQINQRQKRSTNTRQYSIPSLLSGFNRRKLNEDNELAQQMKELLKLLLTNESLVEVPDEAMEVTLGDCSLDPVLRDGFKEIGLTEL